MILTLIFFSTEFQINSSVIVFSHAFINRHIWGVNIPASAIAAFEPAFVIVSAVILIRLWKNLAQYEPGEIGKITIGLGLTTVAFLILTASAKTVFLSEAKVSMLWIAAASFLLGAAETCIMPPLIAAITRHGPPHLKATLTGTLYLAIAFSGYFSGKIAALTTPKLTHPIGIQSSPFIKSLYFSDTYYILFKVMLAITLLIFAGQLCFRLFFKRNKLN